MKPRKPHPTDQELEIMKAVWERGSATVREVYQDLLKKRKIAYTTVLTMMGILEQKGHLKREAGDKAYIYSPAQPRDKVVGGMINDFVNRVLNGSARPLMVHLLEKKDITRDELDELGRLLRERRKKQ